MNRIIKIFILVGLFFSFFMAGRAQAQPFPIFLLQGHNALTPPYNFTQYVNGVLPIIWWSDIETCDPLTTIPASSCYNWSLMDAAKAAADSNYAFWDLSITAGIEMPTWFISAYPSAIFTGCASGVKTPIPWATTAQGNQSYFLEEWTTLIAAAAARYCPSGICDPYLHHIDMGGINVNFPNMDFLTGATGGTCGTTSDATQWNTDGYTVATVESSMSTIFNALSTDFPAPMKFETAPEDPQNFPLVTGQGTQLSQQMAYLNYFATNYANRGILEVDSQNCPTPNPSGCFTSATTTNVVQANPPIGFIVQSTSAQNTYGTCSNNATIACTTTNATADCGAGHTCTPGNYWLVNTGIQAAAIYYTVGGLATVGFEAYITDAPNITVPTGGVSNW
jgi:hypothetical protein